MGQRNFKPKHRTSGGGSGGRKFNGRKYIDEMYDSVWEAYRRRFLAINKECYACGQPATVVDHLKPHQGDEQLFKKTDNHIPLCVTCHNTVTSLFDRRYQAGNPITEKIQWLNRRRQAREGWLPRRVKVLPTYGV
jgi:5-methylcytosine-specific restriction endonuclease McrA